MRDLKGKVAVVTGGASGIGLAMAERFAREGMRIVIADVEAGALAKARDALATQGAEVLAARTDVSRAEDVEALARQTFETFGTAHIVCNNAGVAIGGGPAWQVSRGDWEWTLGVNVWGVIHGVRAFVPRLVEQGEGHVINTASIAGLVAVPGMAPYCVSKSAVVALSESLHHDLTVSAGGKVKVSVLCPAWVKTKIALSERNRPSAHGAPAPLDARSAGVANAVRAAVNSGIPPEVVAEKVYQAVLEDRFWIITHTKTKRMIEKRGRGILEDQNPEFDPFG
ncbi:MAG TPA: SDR family NAD(P)-dependent oxidoreductase [Polyangiaceae bacterium]|jgi:NAD(P)-dependent dehydrogenase (short-subunit alcohol dehydrogenase family)|nr:SDR family NAD(P)-dependent oxidoreductase [Polyangiaceae bacterium]